MQTKMNRGASYFSPRNKSGTKLESGYDFRRSFPMKNHKAEFGYDKDTEETFFAQGDNGGRSHNRFKNKGNDILARKRQSNMRNIGYGISTSVKPKKLHLTYEDY